MTTYKTHDDLFRERVKDADFWKEFWRQEPYFSVAKKLRALRNRQAMTQEELAEASGTHQSRISKLESADLDFRLSTLIQVVEALNAHVDINIVADADFSVPDLADHLFRTKVSITNLNALGYTGANKNQFVRTTIPSQA